MKYTWIGFSLLRWLLVVFMLLLLGITTTILFQWKSANTRDAVRLWDMEMIKNTLDVIWVKWGNLHLPANNKEVDYKGWLLWTQWVFSEPIWIWNTLLKDPLYGNQYTYSINNFRSKYEISSVSESWNKEGPSLLAWKWTHRAMLQWTYNGKFLKTSSLWTDYILALPSITSSSLDDNDIITILSKKNLVYGDERNIPSSYGELWYNMNGQVDYSNNSPVVFKGKFSSLKRWSEQLLFWVKLKKAYEGTFLEDRQNFRELKWIDGTNKKRESVQVIADYICNNVWWLGWLLTIKDCN